MKINAHALFLLALLFTIVSCKKDVDDPEVVFQNSILIGNQGAWGANNGSITAYNPQTKETVANVFETVNGYKLGDLVQSLTYFDDKVYICVMGSDKIEIADRNTMEVTAGIQDVLNPRYILPVSRSKAYVSSWEFGESSEIAVVNLLNNTKTNSIATGWVENMVLQGQFAWAPSLDTNKIFLINLGSDVIVNEVDVNFAPQSLIKDKDDHVWVLSQGEKDWMSNTNNNTPGSIARIDTLTKTVQKEFFFPSDLALGTNLTIDPTLQTLYYIYDGDVYKMDVDATALPTTPMVDLPNSLQAVGARSNTEVYVSETSFSSNGQVYIYDDTRLVDSLTAGIGASSFSF